ncbi:MAG: hypothetical protein ACO3AT_01515, partial [Ilumatobacteraceae bacterium]
MAFFLAGRSMVMSPINGEDGSDAAGEDTAEETPAGEDTADIRSNLMCSPIPTPCSKCDKLSLYVPLEG